MEAGSAWGPGVVKREVEALLRQLHDLGTIACVQHQADIQMICSLPPELNVRAVIASSVTVHSHPLRPRQSTPDSSSADMQTLSDSSMMVILRPKIWTATFCTYTCSFSP